MNDFFDQLRDNLERREEPVFEEASWAKMQEKLNAQKVEAVEGGARSNNFLWLAFSLLFLSLLGSNIYSLAKYNELNKKFSSIQETTTTEASKDAVQRVNNVYHRDTIYITKYIQAPTETNTSLNNRKNIVSTNHNFSNQWKNILSQSNQLVNTYSTTFPKKDFLKTTALLNQSEDKENGIIISNSIGQQSSKVVDKSKKDRQKHLTVLDYLSDNSYASSNAHKALGFSLYVPTILNRSNRLNLRQRIQLVKQKFDTPEFSIGMTGGLGVMHRKELENAFSFNFGIEGQVNIVDNFGVWASVNYEKLNFDSSKFDDKLGIPMFAPINDGDVFMEVNFDSKTIFYQAGVQYLFNNKSKFTPLIGIGYGSGMRIKNTIIYAFLSEDNNNGGGNGNGNNEDDDDLDEFPFSNNMAEKLNGFLHLKTGLNYKLSNHFELNLTGSYRIGTQSDDPIYNNLIKVDFGLNYKF